MRRSSDESSASGSRVCATYSCLQLVHSLINDIIRWLWDTLKRIIQPPQALAHELTLLRTRFCARDEIRASLTEAQKRSKPLLLIYLSGAPSVSQPRERLLKELFDRQGSLIKDYELFFCSPGSFSFSAQVIGHIVGEYSIPPNVLCKCVCLLPFAFTSTLMQRGRSQLTNLVDPLSGIPQEQQQALMSEILRARVDIVPTPAGITLNMKPDLLPQSTIIKAYTMKVDEECDAASAVALLVALAEHSHGLIAPIISRQSERMESIQEARRIREMQDREYQAALEEDKQRSRKRELERARELELEQSAEAERQSHAQREEVRKQIVLQMVELGRRVNLAERTENFSRICIRINGAKLLSYCHPNIAIRTLESAIKNLDLLLSEADPSIKHPVLVVGQEPAAGEPAPVLIIEGGDNGWIAQPCGPFTDDYGLISALPSQQIKRDCSLLQNGIESNCSILWGKLPSPVIH